MTKEEIIEECGRLNPTFQFRVEAVVEFHTKAGHSRISRRVRDGVDAERNVLEDCLEVLRKVAADAEH